MDSSTVCTYCGKEKKSLKLDFYISNSIALKSRGRMTVCKDCIVEIYGDILNEYDDSRVAMYHTCRLLDVYYGEKLYSDSMAEAQTRNTNFVRMYFKNLNSLQQYKGLRFKDGEDLESATSMREDRDGDVSEYKPSREVIRIFGRDRNLDDYYYLETEYNDWMSRFRKEEITKSIEVLVKSICNLCLIIDRKNLNGDDTTKETKALQELMKSSNLTPSQDAGSGDEDPFGVMIKVRENQKPIPKPSMEWEDVDGIMKYMNVWFFGHLAKMMGKSNDLSKMYDEEIKKYDVDLNTGEPSTESGDI